jgi:hypothetical protein
VLHDAVACGERVLDGEPARRIEDRLPGRGDGRVADVALAVRRRRSRLERAVVTRQGQRRGEIAVVPGRVELADDGGCVVEAWADLRSSRQRRLGVLQPAAEHFPKLGGVLVAVLGDGMRYRGVEDLVLAAGDGERAADLVGYLAAVDHLSGHGVLPSIEPGPIPAVFLSSAFPDLRASGYLA